MFGKKKILKQASRQWQSNILEELKKLGYVQSYNEYSLFINKKNTRIIVVVYVNDIRMNGNDSIEIQDLYEHLGCIKNLLLRIQPNYITG